METNKQFEIPIQNKERCDKYNTEFGTNYKPTEENVEDMIHDLYKMIVKVGDEGGWYYGDSIKIDIKVKYCPEDK